MGIWSSIGHALLRYGPYVAAPFTGGASLALAPMANAADAAWTGIDQVRNSGQGQSGLGPSNIPYTGGNMGPPRGPGSKGSPTSIYRPSGLGPTSSAMNNFPQMGQMQQNSGNIFGPQQPVTANTNTQLFNPTYGMMPQDSTNPNLSFALNQGKTNALMNQPWRAAAGIYPNIPLNQRQFQPAPMPLIPQATTFQQPGQGADWQAFLQQNPNLMQQMSGR